MNYLIIYGNRVFVAKDVQALVRKDIGLYCK